MAVFTAVMPSAVGDTKADVAELQLWARRLVSELRTVLYSLDRENVAAAASVRAADITGILSADSLPDIPAEKLSGTAPAIEVDAGNGIVFRAEDGSTAARIYCQSGDGKNALRIEADEVYVNNVKV